MRIIFAGTPDVAIPTLEAVAVSDHDLVAVLTRPDARTGRGRKMERSPVAAWADAYNAQTGKDLPILTPTTLKSKDPDGIAAQEAIAALEPDLIVVVAYGNLVPQVALEIPTYGWINLHFSLLPAWRGAAPVQHSILHGDQITGACVFQLEAGLDTGPIFGSFTDEIGPHDTSGDLLERLSISGATLTFQVVDGIAQQALSALPQTGDAASYAHKLTPEDARVRWGDPGFAVDRRIRAVTPAPGAWTTWDDNRLRLGPVTVDPDGPQLSPGQVAIAKKTVHVGTATDPVLLGTVQPVGKKPMAAADWARGLQSAQKKSSSNETSSNDTNNIVKNNSESDMIFQ